MTSIKSLYQDEVATKQFALYLLKVVREQTKNEACPSKISPTEWETHKMLIDDARFH